MILDTIARSAGKRVEQRKQVKPLEQVMKEAFKCREREGIKIDNNNLVFIHGTSYLPGIGHRVRALHCWYDSFHT